MPKQRRVCHVCNKPARPNAGIGMHQIPRRDPDYIKWLEVLQISPYDNWAPVRVCSRHFRDNEKYIHTTVNGFRSVKLLETACPSLHIDSAKDALPIIAPKVPDYKKVVQSQSESENQTDNSLSLQDPAVEPPTISGPSYLIHVVSADEVQTDVENLNEPIGEPMECRVVSPNNTIEDSSCSSNTGDMPAVQDAGTLLPESKPITAPRYVGDVRIVDVSTPERAQRVISLFKRDSVLKQKKIKSLQDIIRNLNRKIQSMEALMYTLKQKHLIKRVQFSSKT